MDWLDGYEEGMLSAVLDMDEVELFLSGRHSSASSMEEFVMPGSQQVRQEQGLLTKMENDSKTNLPRAFPPSSLPPLLRPALPAGGRPEGVLI